VAEEAVEEEEGLDGNNGEALDPKIADDGDDDDDPVMVLTTVLEFVRAMKKLRKQCVMMSLSHVKNKKRETVLMEQLQHLQQRQKQQQQQQQQHQQHYQLKSLVEEERRGGDGVDSARTVDRSVALPTHKKRKTRRRRKKKKKKSTAVSWCLCTTTRVLKLRASFCLRVECRLRAKATEVREVGTVEA
jgi:hypothetical protein